MSRNALTLNRNLACAGAAFFALAGPVLLRAQPASEPTFSATPPRTARVVIAENPAATAAFKADPEIAFRLVEKAVTRYARKPDLNEAWLSLVGTNDVVGLKVFSAPGPNSGTRAAVVSAVARGLISAGVPAQSVIIWDRDYDDLRRAGFIDLAASLGVRVESTRGAGYDERVFYNSAIVGSLVWSDLEFGQKGEGVGRRSFVTKLVTREITKIISVTPLLNHNVAGVSGHLYGLAFGSVDNTIRFDNDRFRVSQAVPEIYALPELGDKVALNITDALICQFQGGERSLLHYSTALNQIRVSSDPVALDVLSIEELDRQRRLTKAPELKVNRELYDNAALLEHGVNDPKKIEVERVN